MVNKQEYILRKTVGTVRDNQIKGHCPFHDDNKSSFLYNLESDYWKCFACDKKGDSFEKLYAELEGLSLEIVEQALSTKYSNEDKPSLSKVDVRKWHELLMSMPELCITLEEKKGWTKEVLQKFEIGYTLDRISIPVYNNSNRLVNVRFYSIKGGVKTLNHKGNKSPCFIFPINVLTQNDRVILCEGESDTLAGLSLGLPCITLTGGAYSFDPKLTRYFKDKQVRIVYDNDDAGRKGATKAHKLLSGAAKSVFITELPVKEDKEDLSDLILKYGATRQDIIELVETSVVPDDTPQEEATLGLRQLGHHSYINKTVKTSALVVGRETDTYVVPHKIDLICPKGSKKQCGTCPFFIDAEESNIITFSDEVIIELMNKPKKQFTSIIKTAENIPCKTFSYNVLEFLNLTELQLMPSLDNEETGIILYAITKDYNIEANFTYDFLGRMIVHPLEQLATFIIEKAELRQDDITQFQLTYTQKQELIRVLHS